MIFERKGPRLLNIMFNDLEQIKLSFRDNQVNRCSFYVSALPPNHTQRIMGYYKKEAIETA